MTSNKTSTLDALLQACIDRRIVDAVESTDDLIVLHIGDKRVSLAPERATTFLRGILRDDRWEGDASRGPHPM